MDYIAKIKEKSRKLNQYVRLNCMFLQDSEFKRIHPEGMKLWEKKFRQMIRYSNDRVFPIVEEFLNVHIERIKVANCSEEESPTLICVVKNDLEKLRFFVEHYRKIGIKHMVFLDNASTDGSFEFLLEQNDTTVYLCKHDFMSNRKIAWINRIIADLGQDKWYLMVDSDELVTYLGYTMHSIQEVIKKCEAEGYKRVGGLMLDMYASGNLFDAADDFDIVKNCCYFDKDTYDLLWASNGLKITGGPRKRLFGTPMKLSKYCLFYFEKDDIVPSAHFLIPFEKGFDVPVSIALLHYKFINSRDYEKLVDAVKTGKYSNNSADYKSYFENVSQNAKISFYDANHSVMFSEENLKLVGFIENLF